MVWSGLGAAEAVGFYFSINGGFGDAEMAGGFAGGAVAEVDGVFDSAALEFVNGDDLIRVDGLRWIGNRRMCQWRCDGGGCGVG